MESFQYFSFILDTTSFATEKEWNLSYIKWCRLFLSWSFESNLFVSSAPFLYSLKTSENRKAFWCFQGVEKRCIGNECIKKNVDEEVLKLYPRCEKVSHVLWKHWINVLTLFEVGITQQTITCSKSTIETLEKGLKYAQN